MVSSEASSGFLVLLATGMDLGVRLAGLRGDEKIVQTRLFTFREDGASELISVCLRLKYDPLPIGEIVGTDKNGNPNDTRMEVTPVEESVWLVEQRAVATTKPGLGGRVWRRKTDPGTGRLAGGSEKIPSIFSL